MRDHRHGKSDFQFGSVLDRKARGTMLEQPVLDAERDAAAANDAALLLWTRVSAEDFGLPLLGHLLSWQPMDEPAAEPSDISHDEILPWNS